MTRRNLTIAAVAATMVASLLSGGAATADNSATSPVDPAVASLAAERGISVAAAEQRLGWQRQAGDLAQDLAQTMGKDQFGGIWIGLNDDRIKVGVVGADLSATRSVAAVAAAHGLADAVDTVSVPHSLAALTSANDWLGEQLTRVNQDAPWPLRTGYVTDDSAVRLGLPAHSEQLTPAQRTVVKTAKQRFGAMLATYTYTERAKPTACLFPYCDTPLRAGIQINPTGCTLGFLARSRSNNKLYAFTAGHCVYNSGSTRHWTRFRDNSLHYIGRMHNAVFGSGGDVAIIRVDNEAGWRARAWVYVWPSGANDGVGGTSYDTEYPIWYDSTSTLHMRVCKSGVNSSERTSCGRVHELGASLTYGGRTVRGLGRAGYCSGGGDSGGPVYASHTAYGIQVAITTRCSSYYQGIRGAENLMNVNVSHDAR